MTVNTLTVCLFLIRPAHKTHTLVRYKAIAVPAFGLYLENGYKRNKFNRLQALGRAEAASHDMSSVCRAICTHIHVTSVSR